jgi:hypothetical protein
MAKTLRVFTAAALVCAAATTSQASVTRVGATTIAIAVGTRGHGVAYDPVNHVYLVIGTYGFLNGRFVDKNGTVIGASHFAIQTSANYTHMPSVTFSRDLDGGAGGFLVAWQENDLPTLPSIHTRVVSFTKGGPIGADNQVSVDGSHWERYIGIAYSTKSHEFLLTYGRKIGWGIRAVRVGLTGAALAPPFSIALNNQYEEWSSVAYNPVNDQYVVAYEAFTTFGTVYVRAVQAGTDVLLGTQPAIVFAGGANYINEIIYNPDTNKFLVTWYRDAGGGTKTTLGRIVNPDLTLPGDVIAVSSTCRAYDALGLAYNLLTQTSFMVSHPNAGNEDCGVEIDTNGNPLGNPIDVTLSADGRPNYYPKIAASVDDPNWVLSTAHDFSSTRVQLLAGTGGVPPTPTPNPQMGVNSPLAGVVTQPFDAMGWAIDLGSSTGTGADVVHVWAWPLVNGSVSGPPIFVGLTTPSVPRPDVGAVFGSRFTNSGYQLTVSSLPGGTYMLAAYMHSTVTGTFNAVRSVTITVSTPAIAVGPPTPGELVAPVFLVAGWAVDLAAPSGTGVNAIHVWAFPTTPGAAPIFAGAATLGYARPDVAAIFGPQFLNSGFGLVITTLPSGQYDLAVMMQSAVTGTFNAVRVVRVTVQ